MAFNIMDMITEQLTPEHIDAVAKYIGEESSVITKAISAAAPMLLGSLLHSTSKPAGRDVFNQTIDGADVGLPGNLAGALTGSGSSSLVSTGLSMLTSLFGDSRLGSMIKALTGFSGISSGSSKSLLSLVAPLLMSMLAKKKQDDGLDNDGFLSMLADQKKNIAKAITPEMGKSFGDMEFMESLLDKAGDTVQTAADTVASTAREAADTAQQVTNEGKSLFSKLLPYIIIALIAWFAYQFFMKPAPENASTGSSQSGQTMMQALTVGNKNLGESLIGVFDQTKQVLSSVTDADSAKSALGSLSDINGRLDSIFELASQLSPEGRQMLAKLADKTSSGLDPVIEQVYKVPGAGSVLGDSINTFRKNLARLSNL